MFHNLPSQQPATIAPNLVSHYVSLLRQSEGLVTNPGLGAAVYTEITDVETEMNGWLTYDRLLKISASDVGTIREAHGGLCSVVFETRSKLKNLDKPEILSQRADVSGSAGDTFTLSLWARGSQLQRASTAFVLVTVFYTDGSHRYFSLWLPGGSYDWRPLGASFTARRDYQAIKVSITLFGPYGRLWLDDIRIVKD